mmetsp:Transcript_28645/g.62504  ORF Transcript_28645/g.62504 Transcript_28645/m.62504 type:complete len:353 (-) Transcript_28645:125-1183(-)
MSLHVVAMLVPVHVLEPISELPAAGQSQDLGPDLWRGHVLEAAIALRVPVADHKDGRWLGLVKVAAGLLHVRLGVLKLRGAGEAQKADVSELMVAQEVRPTILEALILPAVVRIDREVQEVHIVLRLQGGGYSVGRVVLHLTKAEVVGCIATLWPSAHPVVVIAVDDKEETPLDVQGNVVKERLCQFTRLIVEVIAEDAPEVHRGVFENTVKHLHRAIEGLETLSISTGDPLGGETWIGPEHPPDAGVLLWELHRHLPAANGELVWSCIEFHEGTVQEVLRPTVPELFPVCEWEVVEGLQSRRDHRDANLVVALAAEALCYSKFQLSLVGFCPGGPKLFQPGLENAGAPLRR